MIDVSEQTRQVYSNQHKRMAEDDRAMERWTGMFSTDYFGVSPDYFKGKRALDAGCGDTAKVPIAFYKLGCRDISAFDLGEDFKSTALATLDKFNVPRSCVSLSSGDVTNIHFADEQFDFASCHGVLVHLGDIESARKGFSELARVTKRGGLLYTVFGAVGGLFEDCILPAVRTYYDSNPNFKNVIDNIQPQDFATLLDLAKRGLKEHEGIDASIDWFKDKLDTELCVMLQNLIQAPVRLRIDENMIRRMYADNGFKDVRRLKRYVRRRNIRQFMAPLHYERDHPLVQMLYGSGNLEFIGVRA
jgi:ubiquinone/menaquinone biosynthesis C-methylase UbiE